MMLSRRSPKCSPDHYTLRHLIPFSLQAPDFFFKAAVYASTHRTAEREGREILQFGSRIHISSQALRKQHGCLPGASAPLCQVLTLSPKCPVLDFVSGHCSDHFVGAAHGNQSLDVPGIRTSELHASWLFSKVQSSAFTHCHQEPEKKQVCMSYILVILMALSNWIVALVQSSTQVSKWRINLPRRNLASHSIPFLLS